LRCEPEYRRRSLPAGGKDFFIILPVLFFMGIILILHSGSRRVPLPAAHVPSFVFHVQGMETHLNQEPGSGWSIQPEGTIP